MFLTSWCSVRLAQIWPVALNSDTGRMLYPWATRIVMRWWSLNLRRSDLQQFGMQLNLEPIVLPSNFSRIIIINLFPVSECTISKRCAFNTFSRLFSRCAGLWSRHSWWRNLWPLHGLRVAEDQKGEQSLYLRERPKSWRTYSRLSFQTSSRCGCW